MDNNGDKPLTGVKKRQEIDDTRKKVFIIVAVASAAVVTCIMFGINLVQRIQYQSKVNGELAATEKTMTQNVTNAKQVITNVEKLRTNANLVAVPKDENSTVYQVILDALPTTNDAVALGASVESKILSADTGVTLESFSVDTASSSTTMATEDDGSSSSSTSASSEFPKAQPISFTMTISGRSDDIDNALRNIERTIRPITINGISIQGSDSRLEATLNCTTYYSENVNFKLGSKVVNYEAE